MQFSDRLKSLRQKEGFSQKKLAAIIGLSQQSIGKWEAGTASPSPEKITGLADAFNVSADYLLGRTDDPTPPDREKDDKEEKLGEDISKYNLLSERAQGAILALLNYELQYSSPSGQEKIMKVSSDRGAGEPFKSLPVYYQPAAAGTGNFLDSVDYDLIDIPLDDLPIQTTFGVRVTGDSMEPSYTEGDIVFVKQQPTLEDGEIGIFHIPPDGAVIKKYHKSERGDSLLSLNTAYAPILVTEEYEPKVFGKVIGKLRQSEDV